MTVLQYNTVPAEHQPLVVAAEAPKKYKGRVFAAAVAAALILATAVAGSTPVVPFRAASNLAGTTPAPFAWSIAPKMSRLSTS